MNAALPATTSHTKTAAAEKVFGVLELAELILGGNILAPRDLLRVMQVNKQLRHVITSSLLLRRRIFFEQDPQDDADTSHPVVSESDYNSVLGYYFRGFETLVINLATVEGKRVRAYYGLRSGCFDKYICGRLEIVVLEGAHDATSAPHPWHGYSWSKMHLKKKLSTTNVTFRSDAFKEGEPATWAKVSFQVKDATFGEMLDIAYYLKKAAHWHNKARLFHGEHAVDQHESRSHERNDMAWLSLPHAEGNTWESKMGLPYQRFFDDRSLLRFIVGTPYVEDNCFMLTYSMLDASAETAEQQEEKYGLLWHVGLGVQEKESAASIDGSN